MNKSAFLHSLFRTAYEAALPSLVLPSYLARITPPKGRMIIIGAGKAAASMAKVAEDYFPQAQGIVVTRYGHSVFCQRIKVLEAAHPIPDKNSLSAAKEILDITSNLSPDDLVLCLLSGGGSALLAAPALGLSLIEKQNLTQQLLRSGATIQEINLVRRHLSLIKGGALAKNCQPARLITLAISDIPGDDPQAIASGPTTPDFSTREQAEIIARKYSLPKPPFIETPKELPPQEYEIIASSKISLEKAGEFARKQGFQPIILGDLQGNAEALAKKQAQLAAQLQPGQVLLSGGETEVTVKGNGQGGRNSHFLLALLIANPQLWAIACDTDGIDGTQDNAGAFITPDSLSLAQNLGLDPCQILAKNDAYSFFRALNNLVITGPTLTNVNDFRAILK